METSRRTQYIELQATNQVAHLSGIEVYVATNSVTRLCGFEMYLPCKLPNNCSALSGTMPWLDQVNHKLLVMPLAKLTHVDTLPTHILTH